MDSQERIDQINAQIAALKKEKESLLFTGSIFGGPEFEKLFMKDDQYAFFTDIFGKLIRKAYGFSALRVSKMPKERGERICSLVEQLSKVLNDNMDIYDWAKPTVAGDAPPASQCVEPCYKRGIYTKLCDVGVLSTRAVNGLVRGGLYTIFDLLRVEDNEIIELRQIGSATYEEILRWRDVFAEKFCAKEQE